MSTYTLNLEIDSQSLNIIKSAQLKVTIAKPVNASKPNVAWLVFDPFEGNTIEWEENYGIYASSTPIIQNGAVISRLSETSFPANDAAYYSLTPNATFSGPFTGAGAPAIGSYKVNNHMPNTQYPALTFGLQQSAAINSNGIEASPLNAAVVPAALDTTFTPLTTVYVWLQAQFASGTVITEVNGHASIVTFGGTETHKSLAYNPETGTFVDSSGGSDVKHLQRAGVHQG